MSNKIIHNKKGFTLVECVVSMVLFSIVTALVFTIFSISRNQIAKQNAQYKTDVLQSNIIAAYEASDNYNNMANIMGWAEKEADETPTVPIDGVTGSGSIPVPIHYDKITVDEGHAVFRAKDKNADGSDADTFSDLMSFNCEYAGNRLTSSQIPTGYFTETAVTIPRQMILEGEAHPTAEGLTGAYDYTITIDEKNVNMVMGKGKATQPATDLDKYLLQNACYLKCVKHCDYKLEETVNGKLIKTYDYKIYGNLYFQVCSALHPEQQDTYYCVSLEIYEVRGLLFRLSGSVTNMMNTLKSYLNIDIGFLAQNSFGTTLKQFNDGKEVKNTYLDLSDCVIKTYTGEKCPDFDGFKTELKAAGYNFKSGKWYFTPWMAARDDAQFIPSCKKFDPGKTYYEYTPKTGKAANIYYILRTAGKAKIYDTDAVPIFSYDGAAADVNEALATATSHCNITQATSATYDGVKNDVWYLKGDMPERTVKKIVFTDSKEITVYGSDNKPFIRFIYDNSTVYNADKNSIKSGEYKKYYSIWSNTATLKTPGTVYFSCQGFTGPFYIKINDEIIFTSNTGYFEIKDSTPMGDSGISFGMIGEPESTTVDAKTYYVTCDVKDSDLSLVAKITFCSLAKPKTVRGETVEPEIRLWSIPTSKIPSDIKTIASNPNATLVRNYRKG